MTRGDIVYVHNDPGNNIGYELRGDRPAIIVSNNLCNKHSPIIEVVYTTSSKTKAKLPTHIHIQTALRGSIALCEQVHSIDKCRILKTLGHCTPSEMENINKALKISLGLE